MELFIDLVLIGLHLQAVVLQDRESECKVLRKLEIDLLPGVSDNVTVR